MKLGVMYYNSIYERTGAGKVVRTFLEAKDAFAKHGIDDIIIYSRDESYQTPSVQSSVNASESIFGKIKNKLRLFLKKSYIGSCFHIDYYWWRRGKKNVDKYFNTSTLDEDVLLFHDEYCCYGYLNYCKKHKIDRKKFYLVEHTSGESLKMLYSYFPKIEGKRFAEKLLKRQKKCEEAAERIVFVSDASAENFKRLSPEFSDKVTVIHNGIEQISKAPKRRLFDYLTLVTVGTVNARKNQIMIIDALHKIQNDTLRLVVVGGGDKLTECAERAKRYGIEGCIEFLGPRGDVADILDRCNVFVMSSFDEGLPIAGIEALRSGLPIIITDVGGNVELIRDNGILIKPNLDELCDAITEMLNNRDKLPEMAVNSYKLFTEKYSVDSMTMLYCNMIIKS